MSVCTADKITCFVDEGKMYDGKPLYKSIIQCAEANGVAGATVNKGTMAYGAGSKAEGGSAFGSSHLPIVVQVIDMPDKLENFVEQLGEMADGCFVIREKVEVLYSKSVSCPL